MRSIRGRILASQVGLLALVLAILDIFTLITLESAYLQERRVYYLTHANIAASTAGSYLAGHDPYLRYLAREFGAQAGGRLLYLDNAGTVVVDSYGDPALEGKPLPGAEVREALQGKQMAAVHHFSDLGWVMYTAVPVATSAGRPPAGAAFLSASLAPVYARLRSFAAHLGLITAAALLLGAAASFLLARLITHPLGTLHRAAGELARGHWSHRAGLRGKDEIARLGHALDRMADDLQRLDQTRRGFVADASHELRTPLAALRALAEPLAQGEDVPPQTCREVAAEILGQVDRMQQLTEDLLELARLDHRLESGEHVHPAAADLASLARDALDMVAPLARQKELDLRLEVAAARAEAPVDEEAIYRVLGNLLENAVKHTPPGGTVTVRVARTGDRAVLEVADTGEGIPPDRLPFIFQRFYRVDPARARRTGGSGLGLAIADRLVRLHGGEITVRSTPGRGTTFTVIIPLGPATSGPGLSRNGTGPDVLQFVAKG
ncbi:MAG: ATP-binding protein [Bacillota bacterium]|nr:ATP-binding protein [Bacillota bacterium]